MNTSVARFDLITAPARVDRRALSQAWYSALHLAGPEPRVRFALLCQPERSERILCHPERSERILCHPERRRAKRAVVEGQGPGGKVIVIPRLRASTTPYARDAKIERRARTSPLAKAIVEKLKSDSIASRFLIELPQGRVIVH